MLFLNLTLASSLGCWRASGPFTRSICWIAPNARDRLDAAVLGRCRRVQDQRQPQAHARAVVAACNCSAAAATAGGIGAVAMGDRGNKPATRPCFASRHFSLDGARNGWASRIGWIEAKSDRRGVCGVASAIENDRVMLMRADSLTTPVTSVHGWTAGRPFRALWRASPHITALNLPQALRSAPER